MKTDNVEQGEKDLAISETTDASKREFKPTITRMDRLIVQAGGVATALSIGVSVKGTW